MIDAIGIYKFDHVAEKYIRLTTAPSKRAFYSSDPLEEYENELFSQFGLIEKERPYHYEVEHRHQYIKKMADDTFVVIVGKAKWDKLEINNLFININQVLVRSNTLNTTLDDVVINPVGYTGKNIFIKKMQNSVDDVKAIMVKNMDDIIERGGNINALTKKSETISENSIKFCKAAKKKRIAVGAEDVIN